MGDGAPGGTEVRRWTDAPVPDAASPRADGGGGARAGGHTASGPMVEEIARRVLVHTPVGEDAELVHGVLASQRIAARRCATVDDLAAALELGAGALVLTEEALSPPARARLQRALDAEPAWSDIPIIVCTAAAESSRVMGVGSGWLSRNEGRGHVTLLERPLHVRTFATAVRSALRARARQYETRELLTKLARAATERERLLSAEREARATAEAANCAQYEFLATLSHELRTPMNAILGWTAMLVSGVVSPEKRPEALAVINRNARMQTQLIQDLLDVSSIVSGKMRLNLQPADWRSIVELAIDTVRPTAELKDIVIEAVFDSRGAAIRGDPDRLLQIALNLLTNAVKFTPAGGRVRVQMETLDKAVRLTVSDTGRGIPTDFLPFVFEGFRQADGSKTRSFGGLGLGLAIVRHLTDLHGGNADVCSDGEGTGATFSITLPSLSRV